MSQSLRTIVCENVSMSEHWLNHIEGFVIRQDKDKAGKDRFTVFLHDKGLWEMVDARYSSLQEAEERALAKRATLRA